MIGCGSRGGGSKSTNHRLMDGGGSQRGEKGESGASFYEPCQKMMTVEGELGRKKKEVPPPFLGKNKMKFLVA